MSFIVKRLSGLVNLPKMDRRKRIAIAIFALVLLVAGALFLPKLINPRGAALLVDSSPRSTVFIDGLQVGTTPYEGLINVREATIKIIPESGDVPLPPYETKVNMTPGVKTVIRRNFAESVGLSSGEEVSFERLGGEVASLAVVSTPDAAEIKVDGVTKDFTPMKIDDITPGEHLLTVTAAGYQTREFTIKAERGYLLTVVVSLAQDPNYTPENKDTEEQSSEDNNETPQEAAQMVEIMPTGVGFLRVRQEPSTLADEVGRVTPGDQFELLEEDPSGWYKITYEQDREGWVSSQYAQKVEEDAE